MSRASRSTKIIVLCIVLFTPLFLAPTVRADGGAPNLAYVSGTTGISVIDVGKAKITRTLAVAGDPHTILLSQEGSLLYTTQPGIDQLAVLAAKTGQAICTARVEGMPALLALDQNRQMVYVGGSGSTQVRAFDALTCQLKHTFETGSPVAGLSLSFPASGGGVPGGADQLWVGGENMLSIFAPQTGRLLGRVALADGPQYLSIPPGSATVYVTTRAGTVDAVARQSHAVFQLLQGGSFGTMDYDALSDEVYVPDARHNVVDVLAPVDPEMSTLPPEPEHVFHLPASPQSVAITNEGQLGFVAMRGGSVSMLDILGRQIIYTVFVGGTPHFIITGLYPPALVPKPPSASVQVIRQQPIVGRVFWIALVAVLLLIAGLALFFMRWRWIRERIRPTGRSRPPG
jgi:DNA-binding beta-propeller fold protein YncE